MNDNSKAHVNDVIKTMLERSSIRAYTDEKLTQEQISLLQNAALSAPTAMNAQDQRFVFVTNAEIIAELEAGVVAAAMLLLPKESNSAAAKLCTMHLFL